MRDFALERKLGLMGLNYDDVLAVIETQVAPLAGTDRLPVEACFGRVTARDVLAENDLPSFDRSAFDGYALRADDAAEASFDAPCRLPLVGQLDAGQWPESPLAPGAAVRIMTGAPLPEGADCVVPFELVTEEAGCLMLAAPPRAGANVCHRGEDARTGDVLLTAGRRVDSRSGGVLAACGPDQLEVHRRPRIAIFATGNELTPRGVALTPGHIRNSNSTMLTFALKELGFEAADLGPQPDDVDTIADLLIDAASRFDLIISTGGVSTGDRDIFHDALPRAGARRLFWWVRVKPGSPVMVSRVRDAVVACLSGNPFAAFVNFHCFVRPILARLSGDPSLIAQPATARMGADFPKGGPLRRFIRARLNDGVVWPPDGHSPGMVANLAGCDCLIDLPGGGTGLRAGDAVSVLQLR